ncbi:hypothetical protein DPMN_023244 [Dreissena polymorpha]|uniref:Uncharacterized protein n=1 Tax=Dreissena polymorpha TaxID=45954 RepID=A0A9D4LLW8_DREPO|nr:hypothetical protein DPMN_023244 [Dreissena polymorpha]
MPLRVFLLIMFDITLTNAFLLDNNCLTIATCSCSNNRILCNNTRISNVPDFNITQGNNYNITYD